MATITTIEETDLITDSRTDINNNFANLNSDKIETSYLDTDTTLAANSDTKIATQKAVKAYIDTGGNADASTTQKGVVKLSVAPLSSINPIAVGSNDGRVIGGGFGSGITGALSVLSGTTTLSANGFYTTVEVAAGATLKTNGYALYASQSITNAGTIHNNGGDGGVGGDSVGLTGGSAGTAGVAAGSGIFGTANAGKAGGAGGTNNASGANGTAGDAVNPSLGGANGVAGGTGGAGLGGGAGGTAGGAGSATGENANLQATLAAKTTLTAGSEDTVSSLYRVVGATSGIAMEGSAGSGSGSGGGGSTAGGTGGGGGGGSGAAGGVVFLASPTITNSGTISANGGAGGAGGVGTPSGSAGGGGGGGGGGSGGVVVLIYGTLTNTGTIAAAGGTGGAGGEGGSGEDGTAGSNGNAGKVFKVKVGTNYVA